MNQYGWENAPPDVRAQVERLVVLLRAHLSDDLAGIYLHGSLAMGCFSPARSDADILVVTARAMPIETKWRVMRVLLMLSLAPSPIEVSFLREDDLRPWRHPAPYDFHFGEDHRERYLRELADRSWTRWNEGERLDEDLAGHVTVTRARGVVLWGAPIEDVFPEVPREDYLASILADAEWASERPDLAVEYRTLNLCRTLGYLTDGRIRSKDEGGEWALGALPAEYHGSVAAALEAYRGESADARCDEKTLEEFIEYATQRTAEHAVSGRPGSAETKGD